MLRLFLAVALVLTYGCAPFQANPPCTQVGADANGTPFCPLSADQVGALPEAKVFYPGSTIISSNAQGGALNVNGEPTAAGAWSQLTTTASPSDVIAWYDRTLAATGWTKTNYSLHQYIRHPPSSTYCELFRFDVYGDQPTLPRPPPGGSYYEVSLGVPSTALDGRTSPDASGNEYPVMPCSTGTGGRGGI